MAIFTFFTDASDTSSFADLTTAGDQAIVGANATLVVDGDEAFNMNGNFTDLAVFGQVWSNGPGGTIRSTGDNTSVHVGAAGSISWNGTSGSILNALAFIGDGSSVTNEGLITGGRGIYYIGAGTHVLNNSGTILAAEANGLSPGAIIAGGAGVETTTLLIANTGAILGQVGNQGDPFETDYTAIDATAFSQPTLVELRNSGEVAGRIALRDLDDVIENSGTIQGRIDMGAGADSLTNSGTITGSVYLELGNDTYDGNGAGLVTGTVFGMGGNDIMLGASGRDRFDGGSSNDILRGHGDDDYLRGRVGEDRLYGGDGNDTLIGDSFDDWLDGGNGNDSLDGGADSDILLGGDGNDSLAGGAGRDVSFGGAGRDRFVFSDMADSAVGSARDAIRDFEGGDLIDLEDLVSGTLSYRGSGGFTGTGAELRHVTTLAGSSVVQIDVDGDGTRDMEILVQFTPSLTEGDFLL